MRTADASNLANIVATTRAATVWIEPVPYRDHGGIDNQPEIDSRQLSLDGDVKVPRAENEAQHRQWNGRRYDQPRDSGAAVARGVESVPSFTYDERHEALSLNIIRFRLKSPQRDGSREKLDGTVTRQSQEARDFGHARRLLTRR